jgi:hypothetical protein
MTLREAILSPVCLHTNGNMAKVLELEDSWDLAFLGRVMRNKGRFLVVVSSVADRREIVICLTLTTSNSTVINHFEITCGGVLVGR